MESRVQIGKAILLLALLLQLATVKAEVKYLEGAYEMVEFHLVGEPGDRIKIYLCDGCSPEIMRFSKDFEVFEKGVLVDASLLKEKQGQRVGVVYRLDDKKVTKVVW